jgi:hypothetical protein
MFNGALSFNQDIGGWAVHSVRNMQHMFVETSSFNGDIGAWDTAGVTDMIGMFAAAIAFDQDISGWTVDSVTDMSYMFWGATSFDQDLGWCVDDDVEFDPDGDGSLTFQDAFESTPCASTSCGVLKAAFAQSILDSAGGVFDEVIDIEAAGGRRRLSGTGIGVSYTGIARVVGTDDAASVGADRLEQASDALTAALGDGSFLTTLQNANAAFAAVTVDVAATQAAIAAAVLTVIVTTRSPTVSPTPRPTVAPTATRGSDTVDAAHRLSGVSAALLVLALAA